jgi:peptidoglycan/xylan/chitin deacetylase (PgdA/CDA1 family)
MVAFVAASACVVSLGCRDQTNRADRTCRDTQALSAAKYKGAGLPPKTIALTFDDGPGARTLELSHFLAAEGIRAAFFVNGKMMPNGVAILQDLVADGHVIANHTQTHPDLTTLGAPDVIAEVEQTDLLIAPFVPNGRFMFRPPFGAYSDATFAALEGSLMKKYVGPIDWDMGDRMGPAQAADWDCWSAIGTSSPPVLDVKTCGDLYLAEIRQKTTGIVLMHDPYFIDDDPAKGGTVDMVQYVVPILKAEGFTFVTVDEVPSISADLPPLPPPAPPAIDAGAPETTPTTSSSSGAPDVNGEPPRGDSVEPCAPAPQAEKRNYGESGHLRHR